MSETAVTARLAAYASSALTRSLPEPVAERARLHLLDTLAAMISGTRLPAGRAAVTFAATLGAGCVEVPATGLRLSAADAALIGGMAAHADETDDTHARSLTHPGSVVVPAALAMAAANGANGEALLRAIALGYDVCCRMGDALGAYDFFARGFDPHSFGGIFGAAAAAGALAGLDERQTRHCFSYAAQQASGVVTWVRDSAHVEKAFDFAGMPASRGVFAAQLVRAGLSGVDDVFDGKVNFLGTFNPGYDPGLLVEALGERFEVAETSIKKWCVATPCQASLDGLHEIMRREALSLDEVACFSTEISAFSATVVTDRDMPNLDIVHLLSVMLVDGNLTFASSHDVSRMSDPAVRAASAKVRVLPSETMPQKAREAIVTLETSNGRTFREHVRDVRGTPRNPMGRAEVAEKALDLMSPILGADGASGLIERILHIEREDSIDKLFSNI